MVYNRRSTQHTAAYSVILSVWRGREKQDEQNREQQEKTDQYLWREESRV